MQIYKKTNVIGTVFCVESRDEYNTYQTCRKHLYQTNNPEIEYNLKLDFELKYKNIQSLRFVNQGVTTDKPLKER